MENGNLISSNLSPIAPAMRSCLISSEARIPMVYGPFRRQKNKPEQFLNPELSLLQDVILAGRRLSHKGLLLYPSAHKPIKVCLITKFQKLLEGYN